MKTFTRIVSIVLCFLIVISTILVYASESKFISYNVQVLDEYGEITESDEAAYFDGKDLFVTIDFFTDYTLYYYDAETTSFIRKGQEKSSKYGRVELDLLNKKSILYMNPLSKKEYNLDNVYEFGSQTFLPLAQMSSLLKASLSIKNDTMRIVNSGYSLVDADYAMSKICGKNSLINYTVDDVIDDIYGGSEKAYYLSCVLGYFGSTIFGLRLSKLDFITNLGDYEEYENFLEKCVTNNDTYIEALTTNDDLINRFNNTYNFNKDINDLSKDMKDVTSLVKDVAEPLKDESLSDALLWINARDWNALFDTISTLTNIADYYLKLGSMCEDNKNMINAVESKSSVSDNGLPLHLAIENIQKKYGQDLVNNIMTEIGQELVDKAVSKGKKIVLEKVIPSTAAISIVAKIFKHMGFDIASDSDYSIMIDLNTKSMLFNDYSYQESILKHKKTSQTEKYRLSAIFFLQSCEQTYTSANTLAKKIKSGKNYNDEISKVDTVLSLYYLAIQSKYFDNFSDIDKNIENNKKEINESNIINNATEISQDEANVIISGYNCSIVNKLAQGTWYDLYSFALPGDAFESFTFDKSGNVNVYFSDNEDEERYSTKYTILNDNSLQFTLNNDELVTAEIVKNSNIVKVLKKGKISTCSAWTNEEYDLNNQSAFAKNIIGQWDSEYMSNEVKPSVYQLVSLYQIDNDTNCIFGAVIVDHGQIDLTGYSITDNLVAFNWNDGWFLLEKTDNSNRVNALLFKDKSLDFAYEQWERLN